MRGGLEFSNLMPVYSTRESPRVLARIRVKEKFFAIRSKSIDTAPPCADVKKPNPECLLLLNSAEIGRLAQGEEHDLLAGVGADVVVQTQDFDAGDFLDHGFHK